MAFTNPLNTSTIIRFSVVLLLTNLISSCGFLPNTPDESVPHTGSGQVTEESDFQQNSSPKISLNGKQEDAAETPHQQSPDVTNHTDEAVTDINVTSEVPILDLWQRVREGFQFSDLVKDHPKSGALIARYQQRLKRSPTLINRVSKNAAPYLYFVVSELEKNNIPLEIALIPIVESRYDPFAYSPGRASGLWQFIPGTGKRFGLEQEWWHDERRDTIASTRAAIQYLSYLHKRFDNDWLKAIAAYNAGQGNVAKAIRKNKKLNKPTDYWSLNLPKETKHYIPKLLAWRDLILNPENYQTTLASIPNEPYFTVVDVGSQIDLAEAASLAEVDIETIYQLNPAYNRWATDPNTPHTLVVPIEQADIFEHNLAEVPLDQRITWKRYTIQPNDSLIKIAKQFNTDTALIKEVNGLKSHRIRAGKALLIPSASKANEFYSKSFEQRLAKRQQRSPGNNKHKVNHRVSSGESLWDIAQIYNVSVKSLARWNHMAPGDVLATNINLVVWTNKSPSVASTKETRKLYYRVRSGDSLAYIADKFNLRVKDIKSWNNSIANQKYIQPGQTLTLYVAMTDRQIMAN